MLPKNLGDIIYSFKYRNDLPARVRAKAPSGTEWVIVNAGRGRYRFEARTVTTITPTPRLAVTKVPDATPGLVAAHALDDEQALLTILRYNRLLDLFTGIVCYGLQSHLRTTTTVPGIGQVETDDLYVGVDRRGAQYVLPVQAKGGKDRIGVVQIEQDIALCRHRFSELLCRPVAAQFMAEGVIALFEFAQEPEGVVIVAERHYRLVAPAELTAEELRGYATRPE